MQWNCPQQCTTQDWWQYKFFRKYIMHLLFSMNIRWENQLTVIHWLTSYSYVKFGTLSLFFLMLWLFSSGCRALLSVGKLINLKTENCHTNKTKCSASCPFCPFYSIDFLVWGSCTRFVNAHLFLIGYLLLNIYKVHKHTSIWKSC